MDNEDLDKGSYIWSIGSDVWARLEAFCHSYPVVGSTYMGIDMTVAPELGESDVVTLRKKTPNERMPYTMKRYWDTDAASTFEAYKAWRRYANVEPIMDVASMYPVPPISARYEHHLRIKKVIFNDPATIVLWSDGTKTVVKAEGEPFDPEKGLAMAIEIGRASCRERV